MTILERIQTNPEIGTTNASFVTDLLDRAKQFICSYCRLPRFPELSQGYSASNSNASTNISSLTKASLFLNVNNKGTVEISINPSVCTTGILTAAELQSKIRANSTNSFNEVTVTFADTPATYTITSGRFGEDSVIKVSFNEDHKSLCQLLKLSPAFGGIEKPGALDNEALQAVAVSLVESKYRKLGLEGMNSGSLPGGVAFSVYDIDPFDRQILNRFRRLY